MKTALALLFATLSYAARPPFTEADWWNWRTDSDPRISPDGRWAVYVEAWNVRDAGAPFSNLWLASTDGRTRRAWTEGAWRDISPRWSPDSGRLAWISDRGGKLHIRIRRVDAAGETALPDGGTDPRDVAWSADGASLAFTAAVPANPEPPAWAPPAIVPRLRIEPEFRRHVFIQPGPGGPARQLTSGDADYAEPQWMLDGRSLIAVRNGVEIVALPASGGVPKVLAQGARFAAPRPSPDGSRIAYTAAAIRAQSYTIRKLWVMNADGSRARALSGSLDRDPECPQWSSDSRTVYFIADDRGSTHVYAGRNDGTVRQVTTRPERLRSFSMADNGRAVSIRTTPTEAGDVVTFTVDVVSQSVTLAAPNDALLAGREIAPVEELTYESGNHQVQAWIAKPPVSSTRAPLLLEIHDAPRSMCGPGFDLRSQIFAARGFLVLCANPRGTPGYGEEFGNLLHTRYPGDDFDDLMRGVDAALARGGADPDRLFVGGGLLAAWALGHTTRFRSAVARRPISDWASALALASDGARRAAEWMGALPWEDPDQYVKHSPLYFAANFRTPTLILAGENDIGSEQLYFALRARKIETALVRGPLDWPTEVAATLAWFQK